MTDKDRLRALLQAYEKLEYASTKNGYEEESRLGWTLAENEPLIEEIASYLEGAE